MENFGALTTAPKFQRNGSADTSSATDGFFPVGMLGTGQNYQIAFYIFFRRFGIGERNRLRCAVLEIFW